MFDNLSRFYFNEGLRLVREDQVGPAVQNLSRAVSFNSENIAAWNLAGLCYYRLGKFKTAEYCWSASVHKRREENPAGDYLADLSSALKETASSFSQADCLCRQEKYSQASRILSKEICSRFDLSTGLLNYLGVLQLLGGKTSAAVNCWRTVLSIDKSNTTAARYLADVEERLGFKLLNKLLKWKERLFKRNDIKWK